MANLFNLSEEEKNRIRGLHLAESKDKRISSLLTEKNGYDLKPKCVDVNFERGGKIIPIEIEEDIVDLMYEGMDSDIQRIDEISATSTPEKPKYLFSRTTLYT